MYEEKEAIFPEISLKKEEKIIPVEIKPKEKQSEKGSARSLLILPRTGGGEDLRL